MVRGHWRDPKFWAWYWHNRTPLGAKLVLGAFAAAAFLGGGFLVADHLPRASANAADALTYESTSEQSVTVREHGKTVIKRVPVVRRVVLRPQTAFETRYDTRLVTTPGGVKLIPVVRRSVITVNGKTTTVTQTRLVPTTKVETQTNVVTNERTVVNQSTVTVSNIRNVTVPVTVNDTHTETVVETQPAVTVTMPVTVTSILPVTITIPFP